MSLDEIVGWGGAAQLWSAGRSSTLPSLRLVLSRNPEPYPERKRRSSEGSAEGICAGTVG